MQELPAPEFVTVDPAAVETDLVARYEAKTGKTLYPAQIERLFINQIAYAHGLAMTAIQGTAEKMLVRRSSGVVLDYLGEMVGTPRLLATAAQCKIRFIKQDAASADVVLPAGTTITTTDGKVAFAIEQEVTVTSKGVTTDAFCTEEGLAGNGWMPGQVSVLAADLPVLAVNTTESADGADDETDDHYKERIIMAPEAYTNAGSYGAYRYHALSAHQSIVAVDVRGPTEGEDDGHVALLPLVETGMPSDFLLTTVLNALSSQKKRPLCDTVLVRRPEQLDYEVQAELIFYATANQADALVRAQTALEAYVAERQVQLGADFVPEQISAVLQVAGVYRARVLSPTLRALDSGQWGNCTGINLTNGGTVNG